MKKWVLLCLVCLLLCGCAALNKSVSALDACRADVVCSAQMDQVKVTTQKVVEQTPVNPFAFIISNLVSTLFGVWQGMKVQKKKGC